MAEGAFQQIGLAADNIKAHAIGLDRRRRVRPPPGWCKCRPILREG
jgi:hypothetical protein